MIKPLLSLGFLATSLSAANTVDFHKQIKPIFDKHCISCHGSKMAIDLTRKDGGAFAKSAKGTRIVPGKAHESLMYTTTQLPLGTPGRMPLVGSLSDAESLALKTWINEGAHWPEEIVDAKDFKKTESVVDGVRTIIKPSELFKQLGFDKAAPVKVDKAYTLFKGEEFESTLMPIPGGKFTRGSDHEDEGPVREISISPFWMGKHEVTWAEYENWQFDLDIERRTPANFKANKADATADIVSRPTGPYLDMSFGMGKENRPVICMTQLSAKVYCMWLSAKTGHFYRLPTEAEWEYACRAGSQTKYNFGDDESKLSDYAWFADNANDTYQPIGTKKPNAWGLHDMHGNLSEWVLDSFDPEFYANSAASNPVNPAPLEPLENPFEEVEAWPSKIYDRIVRGGSYLESAEDLRSAKRFSSNPDWKVQDPQVPKSVWYHTDATWVGFRVVRANPPEIKDLGKYWPTDDEVEAIPQRGE